MPWLDRHLPQAWRLPLLAWLALTALILAAYHETGASMVAIWWRSETFTHAFLVPPIALWLAWRRRDRLRQITPRSNLWMLLPLAGSCLLWMVSDVVSVNAGTQFALVSMVVLAVPLMLGTAVARELVFPLAFMFLCVPVGEFLLPVLMHWTAEFTVAALRLSGVPVYQEGLRFVIPSGSWSVVEACSGVRYLIASVMVGSLYAYLNYRSARRRLIFMGLSILVPIVANWLRAYMIVMLGHLSDNRIATGVDHLVYGWVFFGVVIAALFMIGARWHEDDAPVLAEALPQPRPGHAGSAASHGLAALAAAVLVASPLLATRLSPSAAKRPGPVELSSISPAPTWQGRPGLDLNWQPAYRHASAQRRQGFATPSGRAMELQVLYYVDQTAERLMVTSTNTLLRADDARWIEASSQPRSLALPAGPLGVSELELVGSDLLSVARRDRLRVWRWYWINGSWSSSDVHAKLLGARDKLLGRGDAAATLILVAAETERGEAVEPMTAFVRDHLGAIAAQLTQARMQGGTRP